MMEYPAFERLNLQSLLEHAHVAVVIHRMDTSIAYANPTALKLLDLNYNQIIGTDAYDPKWFFIDEFDHRLKVEEYPVNMVLKEGKPLTNHVIGRFDPRTDEVLWYLVNAYMEPGTDVDDPHDGFVVVTFNDISDQRHLFSYRDIIENSRDIVVVTDADTTAAPFGPKIVFVNKAFEDLTGYTAAEAIGETPRMLQGRGTDDETKERIRVGLERHEPIRETILNYSKNGDPYWLDLSIFPLRNKLGKVTHFAAIERDVTQATFQADLLARRNDDLKLLKTKLEEIVEEKTAALRRANYELEKRAYFDELTKLPNRRCFMDQAQRQLAYAKRYGHHVATAILDVDHFKKVNDTHGHDVGDQALVAIAERIRSHGRAEDVFGRMGGEEFAFVTLVRDKDAAQKSFDRLRQSIAGMDPEVEGADLHLTASIGVCVSPPEEEPDISACLKRADQAMYKAKKAGRNRVVIR
ncbi:diguanylate cyclase [Hwanghaeella sp.]|uniref:sensor domain-containing diguanylate cyclase n=1 Tax=Hwanghaeella sp. TaxID=2605943 RepID=UPI003CCBBF24